MREEGGCELPPPAAAVVLLSSGGVFVSISTTMVDPLSVWSDVFLTEEPLVVEDDD